MRFLLKSIVFLLMLMIVAVLALPLVIDPNDLKGQITEQVEKHTGRKLTIEGDLNLSVFPWLGVELSQVTMGNAPGFGKAPFAGIDKAGVRVKLIPLLEKKLEVDTVVLHGLNANLVKLKNGRTNWDDLAGKGGGKQGGDGPGVEALLISGVDIRDSKVTWDDRSTGKMVKLSALNVTTDKLVLGQPFDISADANVEKQPGGAKFKAYLKGTIAVKGEGKRVIVSPLDFELADVEGKHSLGLSGEIDADMQGKTLSLSKLEVESGDLRAKGWLKVSDFDVSPAISGDLGMEPFNLKKLMANMGTPLPPTADPGVLSRTSVNVAFRGTPGRVDVSKIKLQLDDTSVSGNAKVVLRGSKPTVSFALKGNAIDVDRYLPPAGRGGKSKKSSKDDILPLAALFAADINGVITLNQLKANKLKFNGITLKIDQFNNKLQIDSSVKSFYQGSYRATTTVDASRKVPTLKHASTVSGLQIEPLLKDMTGEGRLKGTGTVKANISSRGLSSKAIQRNMRGNVDMRLTKGAIVGFNLGQIIRDAKSQIGELSGGGSSNSGSSMLQTDFSELTAKAKINGNVINNTSLRMKAPYLRVNGSGSLDYEKHWLNYSVTTTVVGTHIGQGGKGLEDLDGIPLPMKYKGPLSKVDDWRRWKIDFQKVLNSKIKKEVQKRVDKEVDKLEKKVEKKIEKEVDKEVKKLLKGLF